MAYYVVGVNIGMTTVTVTAEADGYAVGTATVMVEVVDTLRIETDSNMLSLVEGGDGTQLSVGVNRIAGSEVTINVEAPPGLSVSASELTFSSSSPDPKVITVTAVEDDRYTGDRSETLILTADGYTSTTVTVNITEDDPRPVLVISEVSALAIDLAARATEALTVNVSAEAGVPNDVILTATVIGATNVAAVNPSEITDVPADTPATFTVRGLDAGDTRIRLTASHPDYESASTEVAVSVYLPPLEVFVSPTALEVVVGMKELFTVAVRDSVYTTVRVRSDNSEIALLPRDWFPGGWSHGFTGGQYGPRLHPWQAMDGEFSVPYYVHGVNIGLTTVTVTAVADGYAAGTATVMVEVVDTLRIETDSDMLSLEEGDNTQISVSLNRIAASEVTINVEAPEGLSVSASELTFSRSSPDPKVITVTAVEDDRYAGDRSETLILTADGYTTATVTVEVTEDDPPPVGVAISPSPLKVVIGMSELFTVAVEEGVRTVIWMRSGNSEIASLPFEGYRGPDGFVGGSLEFTGGRYSGSQQSNPTFEVHGINIGMTTVTVTAVADGYAAGTATVMVEVLDTLRIETDSDMLSLEEGDNTQLSVSVNRIAG